MFKIVTLAALGFAAANASFLEFERLLQSTTTTAVSAINVNTTCTKPTGTVDPCASNYCCSYGVRTLANGTATNTTLYTCVPAETDGVVFPGFWNSTLNTTYSLSSKCWLSATANTPVSAFHTTCTSSQCLATRTYTLSNSTGSSNRTACITTSSAGLVSWTTYNSTAGLAAQLS